MTITIDVSSAVSKRKIVKRRRTRRRYLLGLGAVLLRRLVDPSQLRADEAGADGEGGCPADDPVDDPELAPVEIRLPPSAAMPKASAAMDAGV